MATATLFDIERNAFSDGPGIRTTVFFKGCNLRCLWCHNPESQLMPPQMMFYQDQCTNCGKCARVCPRQLDGCDLCGRCALFCAADARKVCGREYTVDEVLSEVLKDKAYYDRSGGGVTFSGGECMLQIDFLAEMLQKCKENGIHTAVDTAGHVPFEHFERILPFTDLFLYDLKLPDSEQHRQYTGVGNELILTNLQKLFQAGAHLWIRIPVIPGVNDQPETMQQIKDWLDQNGTPEKIELLPYHAMGENKYRALGKQPLVFSVPDAETMTLLRSIFN
ncbi:MAG: glycyl-radical enzyme activating protein [Clostridia bacterium]|nr:glycyl-radical enzyme activating protein [Clostridia bacterium]